MIEDGDASGKKKKKKKGKGRRRKKKGAGGRKKISAARGRAESTGSASSAGSDARDATIRSTLTIDYSKTLPVGRQETPRMKMPTPVRAGRKHADGAGGGAGGAGGAGTGGSPNVGQRKLLTAEGGAQTGNGKFQHHSRQPWLWNAHMQVIFKSMKTRQPVPPFHPRNTLDAARDRRRRFLSGTTQVDTFRLWCSGCHP